MSHRSNISFDEGSSLTTDADYEALEEQIATIDRHRREAGRDHLPFEIRGFANTDDDIKRCEQLGVTAINTGPNALASAKKDYFADWIKQYADDVIARFATPD
jgi:hypothetical protein